MTVIQNATAADLDAAPVGSILLDNEGDTATKQLDGGWKWGFNAGSVSYTTVTLVNVWGPIQLTTPDAAPADEPRPQIEHARYDRANRMASVRMDGKLYQMGTARRSPADAAKIARVNHRNSLRRATAYAKLAELLEDAQQEEEAKQQEALRDAERDAVMKEAGYAALTYTEAGPAVQFFVDRLIEARKAAK